MDPISNPFTPGAGTPPPELAGRQWLLDQAMIALERIRRGRASKSFLMVGLRGVGKTVLLNRIQLLASQKGMHTVRIEAPEGRSLPGMLMPELRRSLLELSGNERARALARRALAALAGFVQAIKVRFDDIEVGLDVEPEPGLADNGDLELDLQTLLETAGRAAKEAESVLVLLVDEIQYVREPELAALIVAIHRMAQAGLPVTLIGAGLPQLRGQMGNAKSYAERLFDFPEIGPLLPEDARVAIEAPIKEEGAAIEPDALERIVAETRGYPYFLQEWGKHTWDVAASSPIRIADVVVGAERAMAALDASFFRVRFDRLTPREKQYLRAMAEQGEGPHRSGEIAEQLGSVVTSLAPIRANLIKKGMVYSPTHGETAFTVPLFDQFMRRIMPGQDWR